MLLGLIIAIALIGGLFYFIHHNQERNNQARNNKGSKKASKHSPFHCVEAHHHARCCEAVKALHGKRFLSSEAPTLPVKGCDQAHCDCDYIHHEDRRCEVRRTDIGIQHDMYGQNGEVEHRDKEHRGRRKTD